MFYSSGYFKHIDCPFLRSGLCERHYCHFRHNSYVNNSTDIYHNQTTDNDINFGFTFSNNYLSLNDNEYNPVDFVNEVKPSYSPATNLSVTNDNYAQLVKNDIYVLTEKVQCKEAPLQCILTKKDNDDKLLQVVKSVKFDHKSKPADEEIVQSKVIPSIKDEIKNKLMPIKQADSVEKTKIKSSPLVHDNLDEKLKKMDNPKNKYSRMKSHTNPKECKIKLKNKKCKIELKTVEESKKVKLIQNLYNSIFDSDDSSDEEQSKKISKKLASKNQKISQCSQPAINQSAKITLSNSTETDNEFTEMENALITGRIKGRRLTTVETLKFRMLLSERDRQLKK